MWTPQPPDTETRTFLETENDKFYRAFEAFDIDRMSEVWFHTSEALCVHPGWDLIRGWEKIRQSWELIFQSTRYMEFDIETLVVHAGQSWARIVCYENLLTATEGPAHRARVLATNEFVLDRSGTWRMIHHHASQIAVPSPFPEEA